MSSKEWLTIEDWLECTLPLCSLQIKHEGKMDRADSDDLYICFSSARVGGHVLSDGISQVCINNSHTFIINAFTYKLCIYARLIYVT